MHGDFIFTSSSATAGHPDKLCDQISDAIVDRFLQQDAFARVSAECAVSKTILFIALRFSSRAVVDVTTVARQAIARAGYDGNGFDAKDCTIVTSITEAPADLGAGIDERTLSDADLDRIAASHQVSVFGFACTQTAALMPLPIWLAHKIARRLSAARLSRGLAYLSPDGQAQVAVEYRAGHPHRIHSVNVVAALKPQIAPNANKLRDDIAREIVEPAFRDESLRPDRSTALFINAGGPVLIGGPEVHSGLTGRKTGMDTYGEYARHSGAALSGKDPGRIDRIGAYIARYAAKNIVAAGLAEECEVQISYSIGQAQPVSVRVDTFGTGRLSEADIAARLKRAIDFRVGAIVARFKLRELPAQIKAGFFTRLAAYGQVGRMDIGLPWEMVDCAADMAGADARRA